MDEEESSVPALWNDRGEVAKALDVCIFFNLFNLEGFQFRLGVHPALDDVHSEGDRCFFHEGVLLTVRPTHAQRRVGPGGHARLAPAIVTKG